jgi:hypothetical protein
MPSTHLDPLYSRAEIGILECSKCGNPMRLSQIEPTAPGYDMRTFRMHEMQFQRAFLGRYLNANPNAGLEETGTLEISAPSAVSMQRAAWDRPPAYAYRRLFYLFTPVVEVSAGVCIAPDFGMTVSCMVVDGIFGL